jgi:hypothetical protein
MSMTHYAQCDGADIPLCRTCRRHPDQNGTRDPFQHVMQPQNRGPRCIDWLPLARPLNPPRADTGD